ncbi:hypothetical protein L3Y34_009534 [Caenorhabditis briggsae]|uniref:Lin-15A/B-like domain-containing protein n=1 Tax=Caenorhabditis briggsae TaxID=6238 RepID=A0AAE9D2J9_CAEBR|nr:hypothetical protein L3Y34_009534 [Caenorhabditis briggsae]
MNEAIVKEEVIEEVCNFTFRNGEYVELKQEENKQKSEKLLKRGIKTETNEDFLENVGRKPKECGSKIENLSTEFSTLICKICQKRMPRNLLKFVKSDEDKIVLSENFEIKGSLGTRTSYVCYSHIQTIIDDNDKKMKLPKTPYEKLLRSFITKNKYIIKEKTRSRTCQVCHIIEDCTRLYTVSSKSVRMVIMIGCILRGTHSIDQAISYITNTNGMTCYSHCKESIDMVFEHLGVRNIEEFSKCPIHAMDGLMDERRYSQRKSHRSCNFTFKNGEYIEVKQKEIEPKPGHLHEQEIKTETIDFFEDVKPEPKECDYPIEMVSKEANTFQCEVCQKRMPRNSLKLIRLEDDMIILTAVFNVELFMGSDPDYGCVFHIRKIIHDMDGRVKIPGNSEGKNSEGNRLVLSGMFNVELFMGTNPNYVCVSHIQKIIHDIDDNLNLPLNPSDYVMRSFVRRNRYLMKDNNSRRGICKVCHMSRDYSESYHIRSKGVRMVIMFGCILRGTHSVEQAKSYITNNNGFACYSHRQESIDEIFLYL